MTEPSVTGEERGERSGGGGEHAMEEAQPKGEFAVPAPKFKPPPPKFQAPPHPVQAPQSDQQPQPPEQKQQQEQQPQPHVASLGSSAAAAAAAAARAATTGGIAPGQRDRVIAQVTSAMYAKAAAGSGAADTADGSGSGGGGGGGGGASAGAAAAGGGNPGPPPAYEPPAWSGVPEGVEYTLEVLKGGSVIENRPLSGQPYHTFGRNPAADFVLEHPSASRLHAVLQFNGDTREAFIYDPGSTHGTFLNKQRIKPKVYVPLAVGHTLRFGTSSRLYALGGPSDLMPPEGLSREQRRQLAALEASRRAKAKQDEAAQRAMAAALSGGASWGMDDGPEDFDPNDVDSIDWKAYVAAGNTLNDRQQKLAEKIRSKEWKIQNLKTESERITGKERQEGGLTQGQATTLARNEQAIDRFSEEVEELEETLKESIRDALLQKKREAEASAAPKRKARPDSDDEGGSDSDDDFFDRTAAGGGAKVKRLKGAGGTAAGAAGAGPVVKAVESAESLYGKRELLLEEQKRLQQEVEEETKRVAAEASAAAKPAAAAAAGPGDGAAGPEGVAAAAPDAFAQPKDAAAAADSAGGEGGKAAPEGEGQDSLDAFMAYMDTQIEKDKLASLRKQLADVESQLARVTKLLKMADPDGWLKPGTAAAERAKAAAVAAAAGAEARVKAAAAKAAAAAAKKQKEEEAAKNAFQMDEEDEDVPEGQGAGAGQAAGSEQGATAGATAGAEGAAAAASARPSVIRSRRPIAPGLAGGGGGAGSAPTTGLIIIRKEGQPQPHESRPAGAAKGAVSDTARAAAAALMAEMNAAPSAPAQGSWRQGLSSGEGTDEGRGERGGLQPSHRPDKAHGGAAAEAAVSADLELLAAARRRQAELAAAAAEEEAAAAAAAQAQWQPPSGQRGDGRTSLNDKLGY